MFESNIKILIVEDEAIVAEDLQSSLQMLGYSISAVVPSGEEAIELAGEKRPDLVLMDIVLKGEIDGIEAAGEISSRFNIPIVYITAFSDDKTLERAKSTRPFGYIVKPFEDRELHIAVDMALYKSEIENKLKKREQWLSTILKSIGDAVIVTDPKGNISFMNDVASSLTGWAKDDATGRHLSDVFVIVNEITREKVENPVKRVIKEGKVIGLANHTMLITKDGSEIPIDDSGAPVKDDDGNITGAVLVFHDITEKKKVEKALKESEERYRNLYENALSGLYRSRISDGKMLMANHVAAEILGYDSVEELLKEFKFSEAYSQKIRFGILKRLESRGVSSFEIKVTRKDGEKIDLMITARLFPENGYIEGAFIDITEKRRLEGHLQQAQKMESIGTLAGGIAHDFNNLLMGIQGYVSLMLDDFNSKDYHYNMLKAMERQLKSGSELSGQLLGFAMKGKYQVEAIDLNELIKSSVEMFGRTKKEISIKEKYASDLWTVEVDRGQIEQTLLNIFVNAWQAMLSSGDLDIETSNVVFSLDHAFSSEIKPGNYVKVSITDTGIGMDEETKKKIFDPFFTTKDVGKGTGLGLASVYGIVSNHGGVIHVYSEKGKGTTFNIYLPASEKPVADKSVPGHERDIEKGSGTVLLIDDEKIILEVGEKMLTSLGYRVLKASQGKEAVEIYKENKDWIDLVILDMIMPVMNGSETYDALKKIDQDIIVILSSGYSINGEASEIMSKGANDFIQKPFTIKELSHKVRNALG
ncbi:MAG: response regulator [Desulfobia sp.]